MKTFIFPVIVTAAFAFYLGYNTNHEPESKKIDACAEKVHQAIIADSQLKQYMQAAPFDVVYHYVLGRNYACVNNI